MGEIRVGSPAAVGRVMRRGKAGSELGKNTPDLPRQLKSEARKKNTQNVLGSKADARRPHAQLPTPHLPA